MEEQTNTYEMYELQFDDKLNGVTIRLNDSARCVLRICGVPREMVYDAEGNVREWVDIAYPPIKKQASNADSAVCPVCKDTNTKHVERRQDNGCIGQGFNSWVVDEYWFCNNCGIRFQKVTKKNT